MSIHPQIKVKEEGLKDNRSRNHIIIKNSLDIPPTKQTLAITP